MHVRKLREREREISRENIKAKENKAAVIYECGRKISSIKLINGKRKNPMASKATA